MEKMKTSERDLKKSYDNIISVGYCNIWYLLQGLEPKYYTNGVYGWNSDNYHITNSILISTGYRPVKGIYANKGTTEKYNNKALKIYYNKNYDSQKKLRKIEILRNNFIKEVLEK